MANQLERFDNTSERVKGQFPLSIATSLALESALNMHPDIPPRPDLPIKRFTDLWINLRTLFRNFHNALPKGLSETVTVQEMVEGLIEEMEIIPDVLKYYLDDRAPKITFYLSKYKDLPKHYPKAKLRVDSTDKQFHYSKLQDAVMAAFRHHYSGRFMEFDLKLKGSQAGRTAIITHYAYDLLSHKDFSGLTLLESHTGSFKSSDRWYTKYYQGTALTMIPFREDFLQVFGDQELFKPMEVALRKDLIRIATKRNWSSVTTKARIETGIDELENPDHKTLMKSILV